MISSRFASPVLALTGLALALTLTHSYLGNSPADGYHAAAVAPQLAGLWSDPTARSGDWVKNTLDSDDWIERRYRKPGGGTVVLFVSRSYDLKRLYHHPELAVAYGTDLRARGVKRFANLPNVPVHILTAEPGIADGLAVYALHYGEEFVENPYTFQLRSATRLLFSSRRLMTLFFALDTKPGPGTTAAGATATGVLLEAIRSFVSQARSPSN